MKMFCDNIEATDATQVRAKLSEETIDQYREEIETGADMPAIVVFAEDGSQRYILADGHHRLYATIHADIKEIEVDLRVGDMHNALEYALQANRAHGLRMTNADKVKSVKMALADPELSQKTQQEIADIVGITREAVNRISRRDTLDATKEVDGEPGESEENSTDNVRTTKPEPTQQEVERGELRQAASMVKALPYGGEETVHLALTPDDIADLEYISTWCAHAVLAHRNSVATD